MSWLDKILGKNKFSRTNSVNDEAKNSGKVVVNEVLTEIPQAESVERAEVPEKIVLRDDEVFFISKTAYQKSKNRGYEIINKEDGVRYVMDIKHGDKNILINLEASKDNVTKTFSRGANVSNNPKDSYAIECNFLSTLKMKKNVDGNLISSLLVLTGDEICDAPKKRYPERSAAKAQQRAEVKAVLKAKQLEEQIREDAFVKEHGMSSQEWATKEQQRVEAVKRKISNSDDKIVSLVQVQRSKGGRPA